MGALREWGFPDVERLGVGEALVGATVTTFAVFAMAARTGTANAAGGQGHARVDLSDPLGDRPARQPTRPMDESDSAIAQRLGFTGGHQTARAFVQHGPHQMKLRRQFGQNGHTQAA